MKQLLVLYIFIFLFSFCNPPPPQGVTPAFYHWKSQLQISTTEYNYLRHIHINKLYLKFFDVDWNGQNAVPLAVLDVVKKLPAYYQIVPCIFITNRTLKGLSPSQIPLLSEQIIRKTEQVLPYFQHNRISEIQIDCDWTMTTMTTYFELLTQLRKKLAEKKIALSATIRLHQIKFPDKTGIPPADRGMLMFYNMEDVGNPQTKNSILNPEVARTYLSSLHKYPLPLDVVLPLFRWGVLFREGQLIKLIHGLKPEELSDKNYFLQVDKSHFKVEKSTYLRGHYLYKEDVLRLEDVKNEELLLSAQILKNKLRSDSFSLGFYHLHPEVVKDYPPEILQGICRQFE